MKEMLSQNYTTGSKLALLLDNANGDHYIATVDWCIGWRIGISRQTNNVRLKKLLIKPKTLKSKILNSRRIVRLLELFFPKIILHEFS